MRPAHSAREVAAQRARPGALGAASMRPAHSAREVWAALQSAARR